MFLSPRRRAHHRNQVAAFLARRRSIRAAAADVAAQKHDVNGAREKLVALKADANAAHAEHAARVADRSSRDAVRTAVMFPLFALLVVHLPSVIAFSLPHEGLIWPYWTMTGPALVTIGALTLILATIAIRATCRHQLNVRRSLTLVQRADSNVHSATVQVRLQEAILDAASRRLTEAKRR